MVQTSLEHTIQIIQKVSSWIIDISINTTLYQDIILVMDSLIQHFLSQN